jgi:hypothetical protein
MLKHRQLLLPQIASAPHDRFASLKNLERAEKRFLACFLMALTTGAYTLAMQLWDLKVNDLASLPIYRVVWTGLGAATLASAILAILAYLSVGLVIQRAVEIRPREEREAE